MNTTTSTISPVTMSKLYIGNLPSDINEMNLRQLFAEQNLSCTNVLVKRGGYAFVDCPDQSSADKAIDKLNGKFQDIFHLLPACCVTYYHKYVRGNMLSG